MKNNNTFDLKIRFITHPEAKNDNDKVTAIVSNVMTSGVESSCGYFTGEDAIELYNYITGESISLKDIE